MKIIGLLGHQGVGKNYISENIISKLLLNNYIIMAFADHFKIDCITKQNLNYHKIKTLRDFDCKQYYKHYLNRCKHLK